MNRWSILSIGTLLLFSVAVCSAQSASSSGLFSSDLVAWSGMQQPTAPEQNHSQQHQQPTPEPTPETQPPATQNGSPATGQSSASAGSQVPSAGTYTGTVSKEGDGFTLKVSSSTSYKLDNQQQVQQYDGQRVRVTGTLEPSINLIHVDKIEPLS
jgi:hypothetical protein